MKKSRQAVPRRLDKSAKRLHGAIPMKWQENDKARDTHFEEERCGGTRWILMVAPDDGETPRTKPTNSKKHKERHEADDATNVRSN